MESKKRMQISTFVLLVVAGNPIYIKKILKFWEEVPIMVKDIVCRKTCESITEIFDF